METKPFWRSKTYWYNVAMILLAAATELAPLVDLLTDAELVAHLRDWLIVATVVGNLILRTVTNTKVTMK